MKTLLLNGSPHSHGCTFTALSEVAKALNEEGVSHEFFQLGDKPVHGCVACGYCRAHEACVFTDDVLPSLVEAVKGADALVIGSPVYFAGANGALCALLDRLFYFSGPFLHHKPGAAVVSCRRGGASAAFDRLNKYFTIARMPVVSSQYWNAVHGMDPEEVRKDLEGLQIMRTLGKNMAWMLKNIRSGHIPIPPKEELLRTNFADGK
ncbi:MAG: 2-amino-4-deoxychorismate dehydrogenase [Lentisphaerae bacterium ADurb.Bin242]|nr:MAG: 2-amino-4-deoxychorismate dehydrogenase [Lentisphaerae bacterium ADurb.Bin242]